MSSAFRTLCFLVLLAATPSLYAANPCLTGGFPQPLDGTGTGGTGHGPLQQDGTGTGGTGHGPLQEDGSGMGGTGHTPWISGSTDSNGMGGTGHGPLQQDGTGTGGTGHTPGKQAGDGTGMGGTGHDIEVEGVVTGFASVCVNGLELHYQPTTPVAVNGRIGSPKDLAVGQVVRAQAVGNGDQFAISRLQIRHLMVATLQDISSRSARAMGQIIVLDDGAGLPSGLASGQKVAISGFVSAGGIIIATRIDAVSADSPDSITGEASEDGQGRLKIGGVPVDRQGVSIKAGENVRAEGRYDNGRFQIGRVEHDGFPARADRFVIQGPVKETGKNRINVGGNRLAVDPSSPTKQEMPHPGQWVRVEGQQRGKDRVIDKIEVQERTLSNHTGPKERVHRNTAGSVAREATPTTEQPAVTGERPQKPESPERSGKTEAPERPEKIEATERPEKVEAPERPEKVEAPERPEKVEAPERPEKVEAPERPEKVEAPERPEKVETPERPEKAEAPERPERAERSETREARG